MNETWKIVKDTDSIYQISSLGRLKTNNWKNHGLEKVMKPARDKKGYLRTVIKRNGKLGTVKLHRLVAETFIPNPENKPQVNHKNGIKDDNRVENLEWCTNSENHKHSFAIGTQSNKGENNPTNKLTDKMVLYMRSHPEIRTLCFASIYRLERSTIKRARYGKTWTHLNEFNN